MGTHNVNVRAVNFLRGPNLHAYMPVMVATLDIGPYEELPSTSFAGFVDRIVQWLPGLKEHKCGVGRPGGFVERLRDGTYFPHICEHVTLELQAQVGFPVKFGRARGTGERGVYHVIVSYMEGEPARTAFEIAIRLTLAAMHDEPFDLKSELQHLQDVADEYRLGPSTAAIVNAARARSIPIHRLTPTSSLVQLGWGIHQKRIRAAQTSQTSSVAVEMCQEKLLTNQLLQSVGVPVPKGSIVTSADDAWRVANEIGLPVVLKPAEGNQGKGVSVNLSDEDAIRCAFAIAQNFGQDVLVENYVQGQDYRLLVVNGKMIAAARRDPPMALGDGQHTIAELVEMVNQDPRRGSGHVSVLTRINIDDSVHLVLKQQGFTPSSIPEPGHPIKLRQNCNLSTGGTATDVTDEVHPKNADFAELAAHVMGLDIAGLDIVCQDISRPLDEQGGAIIEVNASPGLRMHLYPSQGQRRNVGEPIVEMLFPNGTPSRIPIIAVTGTNGKTTVTRLISHILKESHKVVGMTSTDGVFVNGERIINGDCSGPQSALAVLLNPKVEVGVFETARGGILREGLGFDACEVGVVTNVAADHLGLEGIDTVEEMARVKQVVVESVAKDGTAVLNGDDQLVASMASACEGKVVYFSTRPNNPVITAHLASGGRSVFVDQDAVILASGASREELIKLSKIPSAANGKIGFQVQNVLAAAAAAWAAGIEPALIARALSRFRTDSSSLPGRLNIMEIGGVQVILDYGHNPHALAALGQAIEALGKRRTHMLIGLPGDRRDEDLWATIDVTKAYVDAYLVMDQAVRRGRAKGEIFRLVKSRLQEETPCTYVGLQDEAIVQALQQANPGERLIIIADKVGPAIEVLQQYQESSPSSTMGNKAA